MKENKIKSYNWGIIAEFIAIIFLKLKGYKILKRRYKTFMGEVDIVAKKGKFLIAVEVKARKTATSSEEVLSKHQQNRIKRAMMFFMTANFKKYFNHSVRFDLIIVSPYKLPKHYQGFWE